MFHHQLKVILIIDTLFQATSPYANTTEPSTPQKLGGKGVGACVQGTPTKSFYYFYFYYRILGQGSLPPRHLPSAVGHSKTRGGRFPPPSSSYHISSSVCYSKTRGDLICRLRFGGSLVCRFKNMRRTCLPHPPYLPFKNTRRASAACCSKTLGSPPFIGQPSIENGRMGTPLLFCHLVSSPCSPLHFDTRERGNSSPLVLHFLFISSHHKLFVNYIK